MVQATHHPTVSPPVVAQAENALMGFAGSLWLVVGGFMLCLTVWGAFFGIPMILAGILLPAAEAVMAWKGLDWSGATGPEQSSQSGTSAAPVALLRDAEPPRSETAIPEDLRGEAGALCETLTKWRTALAQGQEGAVGDRTAAALDQLVTLLQEDLRRG
ncbi:MAG: hypothetical protein HY319_27235 [Armatimonadetes bacterium]|nr:hypothetical protein [Armatimonadota bacterium]